MLHKAVLKNYVSVAELLMDSGVSPLDHAMGRITPLHIAIYKGFDEMGALIVSKLPKFYVGRMSGDPWQYLVRGEKAEDNRNKDTEYCSDHKFLTIGPMFKMKQLMSGKLDKTLLQVLTSFIEKDPLENKYEINVAMLDIVDEERSISDAEFNCNQTNFQALVQHKKEDALNHPVVREYMEHNWNMWCRKISLFNVCRYLFGLFCLTYSAVTGVTASDVHTYDTPFQYSRAVMEVISYLYALAVLFDEIRQMKRYKRKYFYKFFNYIELFSAILMIVVLPLRYTHLRAHWYVFGLGYFLWAIRIFKYALVFSKTGFYAVVIKRILVEDFVQFSILFLVVNTIFSGTFLLMLKAENGLYTHNDTSSFQGISYVGVRTLIEATPIVDYTGSDGYRIAGTICMLVYMFFTIVVMLNILIAQLSATYSRTQKEYIHIIRANRGRIIARAQRNKYFLFKQWSWRQHYRSEIFVNDNKKKSMMIDDLSKTNETMRKKQIQVGLDVWTIKEMFQSFEEKNDALTKKQIQVGLDVRTVKEKFQSFEEKNDALTKKLERIEQILLQGQAETHV